MIWEYCGNTEDYPEATRCYCCSLNIFHSPEEHNKILREGWKSREHKVKAPKPHRTVPMSRATVERRLAAQKKQREFHDLVWKDSVS